MSNLNSMPLKKTEKLLDIAEVQYEIALKEGYPLDSTLEEVAGLQTNTVFRIVAPDGMQTFHVCLDEELAETDIERLRLFQQPSRVLVGRGPVPRHAALAGDRPPRYVFVRVFPHYSLFGLA